MRFSFGNRFTKNNLSNGSKFSKSNLAGFVIVFASLGYYVVNSSLAASTITVNLPSTSNTCSTRFSSQDVWPGYFYEQPPPPGGPTLTQRIDALGLDYWRIQAVTGYDDGSTSKPYPQAFTGTDGHSVSGWNFATLDKVLSDGPASAARLLDITSPPDTLFTGTGPLGGSNNSPGTLADQSYNALAQYYANVVKYFRTGILQNNSGASVSYTATSLTDTSKNFTAYGGGGYSVTATATDDNGFPDWETAAITSVTNSGHTLNFSSWSNRFSGGKVVPAAGAAYNLAATTPPITSPVNAKPWPRPPSVGNVQYYELFNESDLSNTFFPRSSPTLTAPDPILTPVNVAGGTLSPGTTYAYRLTGAAINAAQTTPGTEVSVTLPAGMNAIKLDWSATTSVGLSPFSYRIYGRSAGTEKAMVSVGKDASTGLTWTDKGTVTPSGALPTTNTTGGLQIWRSREYTKMWNVVQPAIKAVDPTIKAIGPVTGASSGAIPSADTTIVTTGPNDDSWRDHMDWIPRLLKTQTPGDTSSGTTPATQPDIVSYHMYGAWQGSTTSDAQYFIGQLGDFDIPTFLSTDSAIVGSKPVWITETNTDAGFLDNDDFRAVTQMGSAWLADAMVQHCLRAPQIQQLFQFEVANTHTWNLFGENAPSTCYPKPACTNSKSQQPNLEYWMIYWASRYFPAGSKVATVSGVPAGFVALAVQPPNSTKVSMIVINTQSGSSPGVGVPGSVQIQLSGATSSDTKEIVIDGNTDVVNGPTETNLGAQSAVTLNLNGFGVAMLNFETGTPGSDTTPPVISSVASNSLASNSATINWTTDESSDSQVEYGPTTSYGSSSTLNTSLVTSHSVNLSGLSPSTAYHYRVKSKDSSNNQATSSDFTFTTQASSAPKSGDINGDNSVNLTDLSLLLSSYGQNTTLCITNNSYTCDLSSPADGIVNIFDLSILLSHYGT
jgi:hypothetical protein